MTPGDKTDEIRMKSESVLFSVRPNDGTFAEPEAQVLCPRDGRFCDGKPLLARQYPRTCSFLFTRGSTCRCIKIRRTP